MKLTAPVSPPLGGESLDAHHLQSEDAVRAACVHDAFFCLERELPWHDHEHAGKRVGDLRFDMVHQVPAFSAAAASINHSDSHTRLRR
jgi:hypothetical protein